ncbi:MAG: hypothetical protein MI743_12895 [Sneathiellales bacterium]|nr:hypothetical protein [Sneathiellales bacterium]
MRQFSKYRKGTALLLMLLFLWTPFLTYLTTPILAHTDAVRWVVICTFNGFKTVPLNEQGEVVDIAEDACPVLQLFANLAQALAPQDISVSLLVFVVGLVSTSVVSLSRKAVYRLSPPARAPPLVAI